MNNSFENITPDSLTGALFAVEGIGDACTILNGPTGCKFYHSAISDSQILRNPGYDPLEHLEINHFGQPRIPCTYLDSQDYIFGSGEKLSRIFKSTLESAAKKKYRLIGVINSPGAALIGDDIEQFLDSTIRKPAEEKLRGIPCFSLENTGFSDSFGVGFQKAMIKILETLPMNERNAKPKTVNLLGLTIYQKYYRQNYKTIKKLLELCGIEVIAAPGAGDTTTILSKIPEAALDVIIYPEYAREIALYLETQFGISYICLDEGPPIGFDSIKAFILQICRALNADPNKAIECIEQSRARAFMFLSRFSSLLGLPKGAFFSIKAESSTSYALTKWLCTYLGMIPAAISMNNEIDSIFAEKLKTFLDTINYPEALNNSVIETPTHILLGDGNTILELKNKGQKFCGIEIALPALGYLDITEKTLFGDQGALFLLEQILNGLRYVL
ncbi:nitrogenase component 1 [Leadbettera azotonutricia]|nr:nitrogenase component 1 [Leadbettera azotonutricia]